MRELRIQHAGSQTQPYITVSVGLVAVDTYRMASHDTAVALADEALYAAKHQGRDRYVALDADQQARFELTTTGLPAITLKEASGS